MLKSGDPSEAPPELVFGIVSPVGAPSQRIIDELKTALHRYSYDTHVIKLSELFPEHAAEVGAPEVQLDGLAEHLRVGALMDIGDAICKTAESASAALALGVSEIATERLQRSTTDEAGASEGRRRAWVLDSLKRPAEVTALREIYGDHAVVVSVDAGAGDRAAALTEKIQSKVPSLPREQLRRTVGELLDRDQSDASAGKYGQNVVKTFPLADVFVQAATEINRFVHLLFADPEHDGPTEQEFGMQLAAAAAALSPELGRTVGAAIMVGKDVISLGANAHPTEPETTPQHDRSNREIQRVVADTLVHLAEGGQLEPTVASQVRDDADLAARDMLAGSLQSSAIGSLTEFQVPVHAEMAALLSAAKAGRPLTDAHMYVTAYPCHGCAKHVLRVGVELTYLEPYPKSLAEAMYGKDVSDFAAYTGIAPRRFTQLFTGTQDRKGPDGNRRYWNDQDRATAMPVVSPHITQASVEDREWAFIVHVQGVAPAQADATSPAGADG